MTRANDKAPTRRVLSGADGVEYVVTLGERTITIKPKRSRKPEAEILVTADGIYHRALLSRVQSAVPSKGPRRKVSRGLLSLG
jgi:hypothetical protein